MSCLLLLAGGCYAQEGGHQAMAQARLHSLPREEDFNRDSARQARDRSSPAVVALLEQSTQQAQSGDLNQAAATLERALTLEPRNPFVYSQLAEVRLHQEDYEEAENLALKSNSLANRNPFLLERNWRVIAELRQRQGDEAGAMSASQHAERMRDFIAE